jgi:hypothetical protein
MLSRSSAGRAAAGTPIEYRPVHDRQASLSLGCPCVHAEHLTGNFGGAGCHREPTKYRHCGRLKWDVVTAAIIALNH